MAKTFLDPHDVPTTPGTEGWHKMYPYQYPFSREDPEHAKFERVRHANGGGHREGDVCYKDR